MIYVLTMPFFNIVELNDSQVATKILNTTPLLSGFADKTVTIKSDKLSLKAYIALLTGKNNELK